MAKYIIRYKTNQQFHDDQLVKAGKDVQPGQDIWFPVPGVSFTDEAKISDYNPIPKNVPTLIFVNETNEPGTVTLKAKERGSGTHFSSLPSRPAIELEYSNDNQFFSTTASTSDPQTGEVLSFTLPANGRLYLRGSNDTFAVGNIISDESHKYSIDVAIKYWSFNCNVRHSLEGNLMALLNDDTGVTENFELAGLFENDDMLREVADSVLSSEYIPYGAYAFLFRQTQDTPYGLEKMPKIDAQEIGPWGCYYMFENATFETATEIPALTLDSGACYAMFASSKHLTGMTSPIPNASGNWYTWSAMFHGCTALTKAPEILVDHACPRSMMHMFGGCSSLVNPPEMHLSDFGFWNRDTTNYTIECCGYMFQYCTSLVRTPSFFSGLTGNNWVGFIFQYMFRGCTSLTQAADLGYALVGQFAYRSMFEGCTSLVNAPAIKATRCDKGNSMYQMFKNCTSLVSAPAISLTSFYGPRTSSALAEMFAGCTSLTGATLLPATLDTSCYKSMFSGCTNLSYIKCLATTMTATDCTTDWVNGVAVNGTFVKAASADWSSKTGNDGIPAGWTVQDA